MTFDSALFRRLYVEQGGSVASARSYVRYLNRTDDLVGGIAEAQKRIGIESVIHLAESLPFQKFGSAKDKSDSLSALRKYRNLMPQPNQAVATLASSAAKSVAAPIADNLTILLAEIRQLDIRYRALTGKPLGVTGEVAELVAADKLRLTLAPPRTAGYDAIDRAGRRIQIKGRAVDPARPYIGRCPSIKCGDLFDDVVLVLIDKTTMEPLEIWRADEAAVMDRLAAPGSKARNERDSLGISQFRSIAEHIWPARRS